MSQVMNDAFLEAAYRVLLRRAPDAGVQSQAASLYPNEISLIRAILGSPEFAFLYGRELQGLRPYQDCSVFRRFQCYEGPGSPGFVTDFLGIRTRADFVESLRDRGGQVDGLPIPFGNWHGDICEWIGTIQAVCEAKERLVVYELGAGWAPWLVASCFAARQLGIEDVRLTGVEASRHHFEMMVQHFEANGLDPAGHRLLRAAVGGQDGQACFPILPDPSADWGAAASFEAHETGSPLVDYRGYSFAESETVPVLSLATLLQDDDRVDLVHIDVQGHEFELLSGSAAEATQKVRRIVVGTHSRALETAIADLLAPLGWTLELEAACRIAPQGGKVFYPADGAQVWRNPAL